jgi:hypothetical protein
VQIKKIGGGITNVLLKVEAPADSGVESAIVRVFGDNTDMYIDREREIQVLLRLNEAGFGAQARLRTCWHHSATPIELIARNIGFSCGRAAFDMASCPSVGSRRAARCLGIFGG